MQHLFETVRQQLLTNEPSDWDPTQKWHRQMGDIWSVVTDLYTSSGSQKREAAWQALCVCCGQDLGNCTDFTKHKSAGVNTHGGSAVSMTTRCISWAAINVFSAIISWKKRFCLKNVLTFTAVGRIKQIMSSCRKKNSIQHDACAQNCNLSGRVTVCCKCR